MAHLRDIKLSRSAQNKRGAHPSNGLNHHQNCSSSDGRAIGPDEAAHTFETVASAACFSSGVSRWLAVNLLRQAEALNLVEPCTSRLQGPDDKGEWEAAAFLLPQDTFQRDGGLLGSPDLPALSKTPSSAQYSLAGASFIGQQSN